VHKGGPQAMMNLKNNRIVVDPFIAPQYILNWIDYIL